MLTFRPQPLPMQPTPAPHAVARLRSARLAVSTRPFLSRGGPSGERCEGCRLILSHCLCALRPKVSSHAGMCLIMAEFEALKPSNTGWLIADVVPDTFAFSWARTRPDADLLALLQDPQWQAYLVFPAEFVAPERVVTQLPSVESSARPLFILLDATWSEARKIFKKSPYLAGLPVLSLTPSQLSRYRLRRSRVDEHLCTAEVAALCLHMAGEPHVAQVLDAYLDVFTERYLSAKQQRKVNDEDALHLRLRSLL